MHATLPNQAPLHFDQLEKGKKEPLHSLPGVPHVELPRQVWRFAAATVGEYVRCLHSHRVGAFENDDKRRFAREVLLKVCACKSVEHLRNKLHAARSARHPRENRSGLISGLLSRYVLELLILLFTLLLKYVGTYLQFALDHSLQQRAERIRDCSATSHSAAAARLCDRPRSARPRLDQNVSSFHVLCPLVLIGSLRDPVHHTGRPRDQGLQDALEQLQRAAQVLRDKEPADDGRKRHSLLRIRRLIPTLTVQTLHHLEGQAPGFGLWQLHSRRQDQALPCRPQNLLTVGLAALCELVDLKHAPNKRRNTGRDFCPAAAAREPSQIHRLVQHQTFCSARVPARVRAEDLFKQSKQHRHSLWTPPIERSLRR
mmetsp:Transcript_8534/g.25640  ORF Transcript_8534/g.25640 Transcript_8534/m.25640 type:complete len:371 (-) Transcript_8534:491-1603(-)